MLRRQVSRRVPGGSGHRHPNQQQTPRWRPLESLNTEESLELPFECALSLGSTVDSGLRISSNLGTSTPHMREVTALVTAKTCGVLGTTGALAYFYSFGP